MTARKDQLPRPRLSVAMIVRNEQDVLAESIRSVRAVADEVVIGDTGSTDRTIAVARQLGARTARIPWFDDFAAARNQCQALATGEWILWLDAGERLDEPSAERLRQFVDRHADPARAYMLMVQVPPAKPGMSAEQMAQVRLVPNDPRLRFEGRVRESLLPALEAAGLETELMAARIVRHARQHHLGWKNLRAQRDLSLGAMEIADRGGEAPARLWLAMGDAYSDLGAMENAREAFLAALEAAEHGSTEMLEAYYGLLTTYDNDPFLGDMQLSVCLEALEVFSFDGQLLLAMGNYLQGKGRLDLAARAFDTAVKFGQVNLGVWHLEDLPDVAAACLGLTLQSLARDDEARSVLEEALDRSPTSVRLRRHLIDLGIKQGRCAEALQLVEHLPLAAKDREPLRNAIRGACRAVSKDWAGALAYLQSAYVAGCTDPLCLRWLAVTLLSNGRTEAARPVLAEWQRIEPGNVELRAYLSAIDAQDRAAAASQQVVAVPAPTETSQRRLRIDAATTALEAAPPILPIVSQISSAEAGPMAGV